MTNVRCSPFYLAGAAARPAGIVLRHKDLAVNHPGRAKSQNSRPTTERSNKHWPPRTANPTASVTQRRPMRTNVDDTVTDLRCF